MRKNKEDDKAYARAYYLKNKEKISKKNKEHYESRRAYYALKRSESRTRNPQRTKEYAAVWLKNNPTKARAYKQLWRERKYGPRTRSEREDVGYWNTKLSKGEIGFDEYLRRLRRYLKRYAGRASKTSQRR